MLAFIETGVYLCFAQIETIYQEHFIMAKTKNNNDQELFSFPLDKTNLMIIGLGAVIIAVAYVFMAMPDHPDDFMTLTLAPLLLVIAFAVVIPFGIMYRKKETPSE